MTGRTISTRAVAAVIVAAALYAPTGAAATPARADTAPAPAAAVVRQNSAESARISATLRALDALHRMGYTVNTPTRAVRAIRHWQRVNGLRVDGVVGPQTAASLDLGVGAAVTEAAPAVRDNLPPGASVEAVIRFVWLDALEDRAVAIAFRESRLQPQVRNACCWGLFQINWEAHRGWLAGIGVTAPAQLLDAGTNARAALALYGRDGWAPWRL